MEPVDRFFSNRSHLARLAGVSKEAARHWRVIPVERCSLIEHNSAGKYRVETLRPDVIWQRDAQTGAVTGYVVPVPPPQAEAA